MVDIQHWSDIGKEKKESLFNRFDSYVTFLISLLSIVVFENFPTEWESSGKDSVPVLRNYSFREFTNFDLTLISHFVQGRSDDIMSLRLMYNKMKYNDSIATSLLFRFALILAESCTNMYQDLKR